MSTLYKSVKVPADLLVALGDDAGEFWSSLEVEFIIHDAIRAWLKRDTAAAAPQDAAAAAEEGGYQWKQLYLPAGTRVRASFHQLPYFGVIGAQGVQYGEQLLSPSGFANRFGSGNRNAWKALWLRFPGSEQWVLADTCRLLQQEACARRFGLPPAAAARAGRGARETSSTNASGVTPAMHASKATKASKANQAQGMPRSLEPAKSAPSAPSASVSAQASKPAGKRRKSRRRRGGKAKIAHAN